MTERKFGRRDFLKLAGAGGIGATIGSFVDVHSVEAESVNAKVTWVGEYSATSKGDGERTNLFHNGRIFLGEWSGRVIYSEDFGKNFSELPIPKAKERADVTPIPRDIVPVDDDSIIVVHDNKLTFVDFKSGKPVATNFYQDGDASDLMDFQTALVLPTGKILGLGRNLSQGAIVADLNQVRHAIKNNLTDFNTEKFKWDWLGTMSGKIGDPAFGILMRTATYDKKNNQVLLGGLNGQYDFAKIDEQTGHYQFSERGGTGVIVLNADTLEIMDNPYNTNETKDARGMRPVNSILTSNLNGDDYAFVGSERPYATISSWGNRGSWEIWQNIGLLQIYKNKVLLSDEITNCKQLIEVGGGQTISCSHGMEKIGNHLVVSLNGAYVAMADLRNATMGKPLDWKRITNDVYGALQLSVTKNPTTGESGILAGMYPASSTFASKNAAIIEGIFD